MKRVICLLALVLLTAAPAFAHAGVRVRLWIGPPRWRPAPVYVAPGPVYITPAPQVYVAPAPILTTPRPCPAGCPSCPGCGMQACPNCPPAQPGK